MIHEDPTVWKILAAMVLTFFACFLLFKSLITGGRK